MSLIFLRRRWLTDHQLEQHNKSSGTKSIAMSDIGEQFRVAVQYIQDKSISKADFPVSPSYEQQLQIYAFYKQATIGDCNDPQPWYHIISSCHVLMLCM
jgi:hypothetical protein